MGIFISNVYSQYAFLKEAHLKNVFPDAEKGAHMVGRIRKWYRILTVPWYICVLKNKNVKQSFQAIKTQIFYT